MIHPIKIHPIHWISHRDHLVMGRVERWRLPRALRLWMIYVTRCGDGWLWYALVLSCSRRVGSRAMGPPRRASWR